MTMAMRMWMVLHAVADVVEYGATTCGDTDDDGDDPVYDNDDMCECDDDDDDAECYHDEEDEYDDDDGDGVVVGYYDEDTSDDVCGEVYAGVACDYDDPDIDDILM